APAAPAPPAPGRPAHGTARGTRRPWWLRTARLDLLHLDPAVAERVDHRLRAVVHRQLAQDRRDVVLHRLVADLEGARDLLVAVAARDVLEHLDLARRERREERLDLSIGVRQLAELLEDAGGDERAGEDALVDQVLAGVDAPDAVQEEGRLDVLEEE